MDIKPWDDETDMKELEAAIRSISMDGLLWGTGKLVEISLECIKRAKPKTFTIENSDQMLNKNNIQYFLFMCF